MNRSIDFAEVNRAALAAFPAVLARILPCGKPVGKEIVAVNPRRRDRHLGSFKINRFNGRWADFATGDRGGDPVSLVAYLADVSQTEAARLLARMLGIECGGDDGPPLTDSRLCRRTKWPRPRPSPAERTKKLRPSDRFRSTHRRSM
jgi:hypothetical protein